MVTAAIRKHYSEMFDAEKKVADYILDNPGKVLEMNISKLAKRSGTSDATIIRTCKHIGFTGFQQMKINLASEFGAQKMDNVDQNTPPADVVEFFAQVAESINNCAKNVDFGTLNQIVEKLAAAETVYVLAWGNSGAIASDMAHRLEWVGIRTIFTNELEYALRSLDLAKEKDMLVAISHSGTAIPVIQAIELARHRGIPVALITDAVGSRAAELSDYVLYTDARNPMFYDLGGGVSHVLEYLVIDAILYFLKDKTRDIEVPHKSETILSQYKL